jgi:hypothetical protein
LIVLNPILDFLFKLVFKKHKSGTWDLKGMFSAPSGRSDMRRQANYQLFHVFFVFIATNQSLSLQVSILLLYEVLFVISANFLLHT